MNMKSIAQQVNDFINVGWDKELDAFGNWENLTQELHKLDTATQGESDRPYELINALGLRLAYERERALAS